jgi:hypothetical protein
MTELEYKKILKFSSGRHWDKHYNGPGASDSHCNPSYSRGRDMEDHSSKPAPGK